MTFPLPGASSIAGQSCGVTLEAWRVQAIAMSEVLEGAVAGVGVRGGAPRTRLRRTNVTLRARGGAGRFPLYRGGTGGVQAPHRHSAQMPEDEIRRSILWKLKSFI